MKLNKKYLFTGLFLFLACEKTGRADTLESFLKTNPDLIPKVFFKSVSNQGSHNTSEWGTFLKATSANSQFSFQAVEIAQYSFGRLTLKPEFDLNKDQFLNLEDLVLKKIQEISVQIDPQCRAALQKSEVLTTTDSCIADSKVGRDLFKLNLVAFVLKENPFLLNPTGQYSLVEREFSNIFLYEAEKKWDGIKVYEESLDYFSDLIDVLRRKNTERFWNQLSRDFMKSEIKALRQQIEEAINTWDLVSSTDYQDVRKYVLEIPKSFSNTLISREKLDDWNLDKRKQFMTWIHKTLRRPLCFSELVAVLEKGTLDLESSIRSFDFLYSLNKVFSQSLHGSPYQHSIANLRVPRFPMGIASTIAEYRKKIEERIIQMSIRGETIVSLKTEAEKSRFVNDDSLAQRFQKQRRLIAERGPLISELLRAYQEFESDKKPQKTGKIENGEILWRALSSIFSTVNLNASINMNPGDEPLSPSDRSLYLSALYFVN
jgi:hypothetical protein